jgi:crotonobetainyl-CoA:carnitine CoA-transferase CaiB-like acyl-CoA transferase
MGPLHGLRVIDLTQMLLGPYATGALADLGAEVIKIEPPAGDGRRTIGPSRTTGMTSQFLHVNRGKKSIVVDLKHPQGRGVVLKLCEGADVLVHNSRREAMARLGLAYDDVIRVKPDIVYCAAVGFGEGGPYAEKPAYDDMIQGLAAVPALHQRLTGEAYYAPFNLSDRLCGMVFVQTILAAIVSRERTGEGQAIELPMFETMVEFVLSEHMWGHTFVPPIGDMGATRLFERKPSATKDGYVCFWIGTDPQCARFFDALGVPELKSDERFRTRAERNRNLADFYTRVDAILATKTTAHWMERFVAHDIPAMPLNTLETLMHDPHLEAVGFFRKTRHPTEGEIVTTAMPTRWSRSQPPEPAPAPNLGEHGRRILLDGGYDEEAVEALIRCGAVGAGD